MKRDSVLAGGLGVLLLAQGLYLGVWALVVATIPANQESPFEPWFPVFWVAGVVLLPLTVLTAYEQRKRPLGRAVLLMELLGAGLVAGILLASLVPYAVGWGGRRLEQAGGDIEWQYALALALVWLVPIGAAAGGVLAVVASGVRGLLRSRLHPG